MKKMRNIRNIKRPKFFIGIFFLLGIFYSCKIWKKNYVIEVSKPKEYLFSEDKIKEEYNLKWWELFDDQNLKELILIGLRDNKNLLATIERVNQARHSLQIQKAEVLPKIEYKVGANRGNILFNRSLDGTIGTYNVLGNLNWEIDVWGKIRQMTASEKANFLASSFGLKSVQIALISELSNAYFSLLDYSLRLTIAEQTLSLRDSTLNIIQERYSAGIIPGIDLNQAQAQRAVAAAAVPTYKRLIVQTEMLINQLLGRAPEKIAVGKNLFEQNEDIQIPVGIPSDLLKRRPDILEAEQLIVAQNAKTNATIAMQFPSIKLTALFGLASTELSSLTKNASWSAGLDIFGPLINWRQYKNRANIEKSKLKENVLRYEQIVYTAYSEVEQALFNIKEYKAEIKVREDEVRATLSARFLSSQRYDKGVTSYLEFLETQRQAFVAELGLVESKKELFTSYVLLYKALGGGWLSEVEGED